MTELPSFSKTVRSGENTRKDSFLNYESPALTAELQALFRRQIGLSKNTYSLPCHSHVSPVHDDKSPVLRSRSKIVRRQNGISKGKKHSDKVAASPMSATPGIPKLQ